VNPPSARRCHCGLELAGVALVCEKVVRLRVGAREVVVGTAPVSTVNPSPFKTKRLRRLGDHLLVLCPTVYRRLALIPLIIGAATVSSHLLWSSDPPLGVAVHVCLGALILGLGIALWVLPRWFEHLCLTALHRALGDGVSELLPRRFEFDRAANQVRVSWPDPWRERPLADVLAVQWIKRTCIFRSGRSRRRLGVAYELILVLDDADRPRVSLATYPDWEAAGADAATVADFLGVPLLEET
jgi:hypothetical protein